MKKVLIALAALVAGVVIVCVVVFKLLIASFSSADPYPAFMAGFADGRTHKYDEVERAFSGFVAREFPVGSDAKAAIEQMTRGGFEMVAPDSEPRMLLWKRHAGPCSERYSIEISQDGEGKITKIAGKLQPTCL